MSLIMFCVIIQIGYPFTHYTTLIVYWDVTKLTTDTICFLFVILSKFQWNEMCEKHALLS